MSCHIGQPVIARFSAARYCTQPSCAYALICELWSVYYEYIQSYIFNETWLCHSTGLLPSKISLLNPKLKYRGVSFAHNLFHICPIILKFCTLHGSHTAVHNTKIQKGWTKDMDDGWTRFLVIPYLCRPEGPPAAWPLPRNSGRQRRGPFSANRTPLGWWQACIASPAGWVGTLSPAWSPCSQGATWQPAREFPMFRSWWPRGRRFEWREGQKGRVRPTGVAPGPGEETMNHM